MESIDIPLGSSDYFRRTSGSPIVPNRNVYFEQDPTNQVDQVSLIRRPGLRRLMTVGSGPIRKIFHRIDAFDNGFFVVSNRNLYKVDRVGDYLFSPTMIFGDLAPTGAISLTASSSTLFLSDEDALYRTDGSASLSEITTPDNVKISRLGYIGGYIVCVVKDTQRFYWIKPGEITIDPLDFAEAEGLPDGIIDIVILGDQMYLFGKETIEVWYLTGDSSAPFQRIQGKLLSVGARQNTASIVMGNDTFCFVTSDGTVRLGAGLQKVSNSSVEERIRRAIAAQNLAET